jgi:hypothetical protein
MKIEFWAKIAERMERMRRRMRECYNARMQEWGNENMKEYNND